LEQTEGLDPGQRFVADHAENLQLCSKHYLFDSERNALPAGITQSKPEGWSTRLDRRESHRPEEWTEEACLSVHGAIANALETEGLEAHYAVHCRRRGPAPRPARAPRPATPMISAPDLPEPLVFSSHRRVAGLFDETYLGALQERNADAQNQLVSSFSRAVLNKLRARLRSPELIQDAFQETFLRVLTYFGSGKTLDRPGSLPGFVHATCQNVALELLRGHTRHDQFPENFPEPVAAGLDPERQLVSEERKAMVRRLLNELTEKERQLLKRVFLDEEDKDTVCRELAVDRSYLRVLLYRARQRFRAVVTLEVKKKAAGA